jgi:hypothetical protein
MRLDENKNSARRLRAVMRRWRAPCQSSEYARGNPARHQAVVPLSIRWLSLYTLAAPLSTRGEYVLRSKRALPKKDLSGLGDLTGLNVNDYFVL